jgi:DNA-binding PadR family transcriptional regulator
MERLREKGLECNVAAISTTAPATIDGRDLAIDTDRIDDCVLALLLLGRHDGYRVWKTFDWDAMDRLHKKGFISDPVGRAKSVVLTVEGQERAEQLFRELFEKDA